MATKFGMLKCFVEKNVLVVRKTREMLAGVVLEATDAGIMVCNQDDMLIYVPADQIVEVSEKK